MPSGYRRIYWDANVWLAYINGEAEHLPMIDALLDESRQGNVMLVTSMVSVTEVAFAAIEKANGALDPEVEAAIDALFADREVVRLAEYHEMIAKEARALIRDAAVNGWRLRPIDAIHLATAKRLDMAEFHTVDGPLQKYGGPLDFPIHAPRTDSPRLLLDDPVPTPENVQTEPEVAEAVEAIAEDDAGAAPPEPEAPASAK